MRLTPIVSLVLASAIAVPAAAQTAQGVSDISSLREIDRANLVSATGDEIGEIEEVLVDASGTPVAVTVDIRDGFLNLGDDEVVFSLDQLTFENGNYVTSLSEQEVEALPRYND